MSDPAPRGAEGDLPFERLVLLAGNFDGMRMVVTWETAWKRFAALMWNFDEEAPRGGLTEEFTEAWAELSGVREPSIEEQWSILYANGLLEPGTVEGDNDAWTSETALNYVRAEMASKFPKAR